MAVVQKFCCCGSLRSGAITAAVLNTISVAILFIACAIGFINADYHQRRMQEELSRASLIDGAVRAVQAVLGLVVLVFLCVGIHKRVANFLLPWIICTAISIIIWIIAIVMIAAATGLGVYFRHPAAAVAALLMLGITVFWMYLFAVVLSYYQTLKQQSAQSVTTPIPMTEPGYVVCAAPVPPSFYAPVDTKGYPPPPLYPQVPTENGSASAAKPPPYTIV